MEDLRSKIKTLNETLWENKALSPSVEKWLSNFSDDKEKLHAMYLLSKFMYFGATSIRMLLRALYRDLYRQPLIQTIRKNNNNTLDSNIIEEEFKLVEKNTRYIPVGNPSESGAHLLYFFRQENKLSKDQFVYTDEIIDYKEGKPFVKLPETTHYVFIDDFCGSGSQVLRDGNIKRCVTLLKELQPNAIISYFMLFATLKGKKVLIDSDLFTNVEAVIELDNTYKCFDEESRIFCKNTVCDQAYAKEISYKYGKKMLQDILEKENFPETKIEEKSDLCAHGWNDCQLLLGFFHNTPNNTLPIIWYDEDGCSWHPIFKRYNKKYSL